MSSVDEAMRTVVRQGSVTKRVNVIEFVRVGYNTSEPVRVKTYDPISVKLCEENYMFVPKASIA